MPQFKDDAQFSCNEPSVYEQVSSSWKLYTDYQKPRHFLNHLTEEGRQEIGNFKRYERKLVKNESTVVKTKRRKVKEMKSKQPRTVRNKLKKNTLHNTTKEKRREEKRREEKRREEKRREDLLEGV
jgi:hypothetical protein